MRNEPIEDFEHCGCRIRIYQDEDAQSPHDNQDCPIYLVHDHRQFSVSHKDAPARTRDDLRQCWLEMKEPAHPRDWDGLTSELSTLLASDNQTTWPGALDEQAAGRDENYAAWKAHDEWHAEWFVFVVGAHIHSGVSVFNAGRMEDFEGGNRGWDTSHAGALFIKKDKDYWGEDPEFTDEWAEMVADSVIKEWDQYARGEVYIYSVKWRHVEGDSDDDDPGDDRCGGFYGLECTMDEATSGAKYMQEQYEYNKAKRLTERAALLDRLDRGKLLQMAEEEHATQLDDVRRASKEALVEYLTAHGYTGENIEASCSFAEEDTSDGS